MKLRSHSFNALLCAALISGCSNPMKLDRQIAASKKIQLPEAVPHQMSRRLSDFGRMLAAYQGPNKSVVEVDLIPNDAGVLKELPKDLGFYVVHALTEMNYGFTVQRAFESNIVMESNNSLPITRNRTAATFVVKGQLLRNSERVLGQKELRAGVMAKMEGRKIDATAENENKAVVKNLRVGLYLEDANGVSLPGMPTAIYDVWYRTDTNTANISLFVDGTGMGASREYQVNQDAGDAVLDATAACVMQLMGYLFKVPYYRCSPDVFPFDERLDQLKRNELASLSRNGLLAGLKPLLQANGTSFDSGTDKDVIEAVMRKAGLGTSDDNLISFYMKQWSALDYRGGSLRVQRALARNIKSISQLQEEADAKAAAEAPPPPPGAELFGWPAGTPCITIDLRRVSDAATQEKLLSAARGVAGCRDARLLSAQGLLGLNFSGSPADLQRAFRLLNLNYNFVWMNRDWNAMVVVPLQLRKA